MESRFTYYEEMQDLARRVRTEFGFTTARVGKSDLRQVYKNYGIRIDLVPGLKKLRGAYFSDDYGCSVMIAKGLPEDPTIFTMAHELKHHLVDQKSISLCDPSNWSEQIEIGAEVFAAELILPDLMLTELLRDMDIQSGRCQAEDLVRLKQATRTTLSYSGLAKKAEFLGFAEKNSLTNRTVRWKRIEESRFGRPFYLKT